MPTSLWEGRRHALAEIAAQDTSHRGLWLDRYLAYQTCRHADKDHSYDKERGERAKVELIDAIAERPTPAGYGTAYDTRRRGFDGDRITTAEITARGRVVVGVGAKGAGEFGLTLEHTWGVPVLPGSSLKGIAAMAADRWFIDDAWRRPAEGQSNAWSALFGDVDGQGAVIFHDAWWSSGPKVPIHADVLTVHHKAYYEGEADVADGTNDPVPVPFVSTSGTYLLALEALPGVPLAWLERAWAAVRLGLSRHGIGAKTNAGYGRFTVPEFQDTALGRRHAAAQAKALEEAATARLLALPVHERVAAIIQRDGPPAMRAWLLNQGNPPVAGLSGTSDEVKAVAAELLRRYQAKGLLGACGAWAGDVDSVIAPPQKPVGPPPTSPLRPGELDKLLAQGPHSDFNKIATGLAKRRLGAEDLDAAEAALRANGAKDGHIKALRKSE